MKEVPQWQLFMFIYFIMVGIPVWLVHSRMKKKLLENKTPLNLLIYFVAVAGTAFLMLMLAMWLYYKFLFSHKS